MSKKRNVWDIDIQVFVTVNVKYTDRVLQYQINCLKKLMLYSYREELSGSRVFYLNSDNVFMIMNNSWVIHGWTEHKRNCPVSQSHHHTYTHIYIWGCLVQPQSHMTMH